MRTFQSVVLALYVFYGTAACGGQATMKSPTNTVENTEQTESAKNLENAKRFFVALESLNGWEGCKKYVAEGASFASQSGPLVEVKTVEGYCEWVKGFGTVTAPDPTYDVHALAYDADTNTAVFVATYHAKHTGEGGPVPPTNKETHSDYVYTVHMNDEGKVDGMVKVWNATWAMKELGWM